jgi:serine phosphatase RsbU (regulator of sigma subunit)
MARGFKRALLFLVPLLLALAITRALYLGSRSVDEARHASVSAGLARERHQHALLKQQVLAARFGLLALYDPIEQTQDQADLVRAEIAADIRDGKLSTPDVEAALTALEQAAARRRATIEQFKSQNSILKNSLHYLPIGAEDFADSVADTNTAANDKLRRNVHGLVQATLIYNLIRGDARKQGQQERIAALEAAAAGLESKLKTELSLLIAHARTVERESTSVDSHLEQILANDVESAIGDVEVAYQGAHAAAVARAETYRTAMYGWSVALLFGVVATVAKLVRLYGRLEHLVEERTKDLNKAVSELWGEMELAKKIQTALVPPKPQLEGCAVAATMKTADQVGGDYYDVVEVDGVEWVLIGDVSGHGVPAGLVMMMCQTTVRSLLQRDPHMSPGELLTLVNGTLTANIKRLGENKYMTLQALRREPDGSFSIAGLHQDILVYRADKKRVEQMPMRQGAWLGIIDDLTSMVPSQRLDLGPGDILLLYTDGATEAVRDGELLDNNGLAAIFEGIAKSGVHPTGIVDAILGELGAYDVRDDVTLVVIRREESLVESAVA